MIIVKYVSCSFCSIMVAPRGLNDVLQALGKVEEADSLKGAPLLGLLHADLLFLETYTVEKDDANVRGSVREELVQGCSILCLCSRITSRPLRGYAGPDGLAISSSLNHILVEMRITCMLQKSPDSRM